MQHSGKRIDSGECVVRAPALTPTATPRELEAGGSGRLSRRPPMVPPLRSISGRLVAGESARTPRPVTFSHSPRQTFAVRDGQQDLKSDVWAIAFSDEHQQVLHLDHWYARFTLWASFKYVCRQAGHYVVLYLAWGLLCAYIASRHPKIAEATTSGFTLKVLTWVVGMLISMNMKESIDRYKNALGALLSFRDEFRSFWYFVQLQLHAKPGVRIIFDVHMLAFAVSIVRWILRKVDHGQERAYNLVQREFRECCLFCGDGTYESLLSNPDYCELVLVTWLRAMGVMDNDTRLRFQWMRDKLHLLQTVQRVRSPPTSLHILQLVVHIFLTMVPICTGSWTTRLATPVIALVLMSLLEFAKELVDPFGLEEHDIPWPVMMSTVTRCRLTVDEEFTADVIDLFNLACRTSHWDETRVKRLLGEDVRIDPETSSKIAYDSGDVVLSHYLTEIDLKRLHVIGDVRNGDPDVLFAKNQVTSHTPRTPRTDRSTSRSTSRSRSARTPQTDRSTLGS